MRLSVWVLISSVTTAIIGCHCFVERRAFHPQRSHKILHPAVSRDDHGDVLDRNDARVDVRNLLTQRAVQSFMYLLTSVRDPHSAKWIEDFLGAGNQLEYHGTGAGYLSRFGGTWDAPLLAMMEQEKDVVIVSAKRVGKGHRGWSKDNPYLEERFVEFKIDVDPVSLASRILSVREQIAQEWVEDLDILEVANDEILDSYLAKARKERQQQNDTGGGGDERSNREERTSAFAFERTAANIINNKRGFVDGASSPLRKGNFDLLCNICTQASVHRLLRDLAEAGEAKEVSFKWLKDFYTNRVAEFFDGDQKYGRADDFLEELLLASPSLIYSDKDKASLADPMGIAERIIEIRKEVVAEWKQLMKQVPQDHSSGIRKVLLDKQMAAWNSRPADGGFE